MFSYATKVLTALTGLAFVGAGVFYGVEGERSGAILMAFVGLAALLAVITVTSSGVVDIAPHVPADAPPPEPKAHTPGPPARGSIWPMVTALAAGVLAVGMAVGPALVYAGLIALALSALGWFGKTWTDHATWTPRISRRVSDRFVAPVGLPLMGVAVAAFIAIGMSRVLLASSLEVAPWIALAVAVIVLTVCFAIASRPRLRSSALIALAGVGAASVLGAGIAGASQGERKFHPHEHVEPVEVQAKNVAFLEKELKAPAQGDIHLRFVNEDDGVYHNVAVYESQDPSAAPIFNGEGFPGVDDRTYVFKSPGPGTYAFRCDFHANMVGTFVVGGG